MKQLQTRSKRKILIDSKLVNQIASGDTESFRLLYDRYKDKVYNVAISYLRNVADAEEVTQDVFITIFRNAHQFKGRSTVSTWIYRIVINKSLNKIKSLATISSRITDIPNVEHTDFVHPGVLLENKEKSKYLFKAIHSLDEKQQTAFILSYVESLPRQEVADIMGTTLKAVESLLQRAKGNLRKKLAAIYPEGNR